MLGATSVSRSPDLVVSTNTYWPMKSPKVRSASLKSWMFSWMGRCTFFWTSNQFWRRRLGLESMFSWLLDFRNPGNPDFRTFGFQESRKSGFPMISENPEFWISGNLVFGNPKIRISGFPDFRKSELSDYRYRIHAIANSFQLQIQILVFSELFL